MSFELPIKGFIFWNVGCGDSTTIIVNKSHWLQLDLNHKSESSNEGSTYASVVDELMDRLPKRNNRPYLAAFALSHPDQDHCLGFARLLNEVDIGELWFTPRVFEETNADLCDDAIAFKEEAERRVRKTVNNPNIASGDRVRLIGYSDRLKEAPYQGFPTERVTVPGNAIFALDGEDLSGHFRAFIHSPFKDNLYAGRDRNGTSLAMQVRLTESGVASNVLLLGDHAYSGLRRIFDVSDSGDLAWSAMLVPHHCSKSAMYWSDSPDGESEFRQDILDDLETHKASPGICLASCDIVPTRNKKGDNPPHAKAKRRYEEIVAAGHFLATQEHPDETAPMPIVLESTADGLQLKGADVSASTKVVKNRAKVAITAASSSPAAPRNSQRYG